jgi:hypothetical protein
MDELLDIETRFTEEEIRHYDELSSIRLDGIRRTNHTNDVPPLSVAGQFRARGYFNCSA